MSRTIHIVEPTLTDQTGHCYSFVQAFSQCAGADIDVQLWAGKHTDQLTWPAAVSRVHAVFSRRMRKFQLLRVYRRLLRQGERILVSTATQLDLQLLCWLAGTRLPADQVFCYVHWVKQNEQKRRQLQQLACHQPQLVILVPTASLEQWFLQTGFEQTCRIPYPITRIQIAETVHHFRTVLYAGAARADKGFHHVINLLEYMQKQQLSIPLQLQISSMHFGKYDKAVTEDLQRLAQLEYPALTRIEQTLDQQQYIQQYQGGICLQLYCPQDFSDRISGVTLDALSSGCPVIVSAGTWMARIVQRFDAGIVVDDYAPDTLVQHIIKIKQNYAQYQKNARQAGTVLQQENSAQQLVRRVLGITNGKIE